MFPPERIEIFYQKITQVSYLHHVIFISTSMLKLILKDNYIVFYFIVIIKKKNLQRQKIKKKILSNFNKQKKKRTLKMIENFHRNVSVSSNDTDNSSENFKDFHSYEATGQIPEFAK